MRMDELLIDLRDSRYDPISEDEARRLLKTGEIDKVVNSYLRLAVKVSRDYSICTGLEHAESLLGVATISLINALKKGVPTGTTVTNHVASKMRYGLKDWRYYETTSIRRKRKGVVAEVCQPIEVDAVADADDHYDRPCFADVEPLLNHLDPTLADTVAMYYGLRGHKSMHQEAIGKRVGISGSAVGARLRKAAKKLREVVS